MKKRFLGLIVITFFICSAFRGDTTTGISKYKCMIQLVNYTGEGAYIIVSLINPEGQYEENLFIHGDDPEWYHEISSWWKWFGAKKRNIDGITGATLSGGERTIDVISIDDSKLNAGYKIRFETSVEEQKYHIKDVEFELTTESVKSKVDGSGYIRYVRLMPQ